MVTTSITYPATSTGTGTAETTLNSGNNIIIPESIRELQSFTPFDVPLTALTADELVIVRFRWTSNDIPQLTPKDVIYALGQTDASGGEFQHPIYQKWDFNTPTNGSENVTATGTNIVAQTAAQQWGLQTYQSTGRTGRPQKYWSNPGATTATGTAAATVTGSTYRINSCKMITDAYALAHPDSVAVSDSMGGTMTLTSPDFQTALPLSFPVMTVLAGLAADTALGVLEQARWPVAIPTRENVAITESFASAQAVAGNGTFISGVGFTR